MQRINKPLAQCVFVVTAACGLFTTRQDTHTTRVSRFSSSTWCQESRFSSRIYKKKERQDSSQWWVAFDNDILTLLLVWAMEMSKNHSKSKRITISWIPILKRLRIFVRDELKRPFVKHETCFMNFPTVAMELRHLLSEEPAPMDPGKFRQWHYSVSWVY